MIFNPKKSNSFFTCNDLRNDNNKMRKIFLGFVVLTLSVLLNKLSAQVKGAQNPIIFADVSDIAMLRVVDSYYMSSTTMHMSPGYQ